LYVAVRKSRSGKSAGAVDEIATGSVTFFGPAQLVRELRRDLSPLT
jgi:hypothetical protein